MEFTPSTLSQRVIDFGLATSYQMEAAWVEMRSKDADLETFKSLLLRKNLLTNFQLDRILTGERLGYFYGPYKVLYMIGAGTFARVFRAVHRETNRVVAVKVLRRRHRDQVAQVEQFLREGRMGLELRHPNIVTIYEIQNDPRTPYLVMEFVEGETLREMLKIRKIFSPIETMRVILDITTGLEFAFSRGVTHRDLKLTNVLITSSGRCKLVDFGLAAMADTSSPEALADCPSARAIDYAALERGSGVKKGDPRSDIFFVGAIMQHILTGVAPLTETRDRMARLNISRFTEIAPLSSLVPDCPPQVAAICNKALEFDPEKRYHSISAMHLEVQAVLHKMETGTLDAVKTDGHQMATIDPEMAKEGIGKTVLVIESRVEMQNLLREKLKSRGYRVLVFSDPDNAMARFAPDEPSPADCVVISAVELGSDALEAFNQLTTQPFTASMPAVMLVDPKQDFIVRGAKTSDKHILLPMPLKVRDLRTALTSLIVDPISH